MNERLNEVSRRSDSTAEAGQNMVYTGNLETQAGAIVDKMFMAAQPGAVFGEPRTFDAYTVITASEVGSGGGFGFGSGSAPSSSTPATSEASQHAPAIAGGGGGGGGGGAGGRPVAVIVVGPDGVEVRPVVDFTKIALSCILALRVFAGIATNLRPSGRRS